MRISYDKNIKLAGIGMVPWSRLGPERWLSSYAVASLYGWDMPSTFAPPRVVALSERSELLPRLPRANTASLLKTPEFQELLDRELPGYDILTYKPISTPGAFAGRRVLSADPAFTNTVENKAAFRRTFSGIVRFPDFQIVNRFQLARTPEAFAQLLDGRPRIIIQDEQLSGGKGSFIVADFDQYCAALNALDQLSKHESAVVSSVIDQAQEVSVQCCVTRFGVFVGPLQRQVIAHPELSSPAVGGDKFCGVQVASADQNTPLHEEVKSVSRRIGDKLQADGYKGIFGIDFLVVPSNELFVLEVNPRITGATPLLTDLSDDGTGVPFYLLHLLELGGYEYTIEGEPEDLRREGSLLMVHSLEAYDVTLAGLPRSGTYRFEDSMLHRTGDAVSLHAAANGDCVIQKYMPPGAAVKPSGRLAVLLFPKPVVNKDGVLSEEALRIVRSLRQYLKPEKY